MTHSRKHKHSAQYTGHSKKLRKKAFILLIVLAVAVMVVYALSFQDAEDSEFIQETTPENTQVETTE